MSVLPRSADLVIATLELAVALRIGELAALDEPGRWRLRDRWRADAVDPIACQGDAMLYGGVKGEAAATFNHLAKAVAALAYAPAGVRFFGVHWCTEHPHGCHLPDTELTCTAGDFAAAVRRPVTTITTRGGLL